MHIAVQHPLMDEGLFNTLSFFSVFGNSYPPVSLLALQFFFILSYDTILALFSTVAFQIYLYTFSLLAPFKILSCTDLPLILSSFHPFKFIHFFHFIHYPCHTFQSCIPSLLALFCNTAFHISLHTLDFTLHPYLHENIFIQTTYIRWKEFVIKVSYIDFIENLMNKISILIDT